MATFKVGGYEIMSGASREVSDIKAAQLQMVSPLGTATLDFSYASDDPASAEVSLSDYNLLVNGVHLNDGELPERIEMFNLSWSSDDADASSQVMNFVYSDGEQTRDFLFAIGKSPLPDLTNPVNVTNMLSNAQFSMMSKEDTDNDFRIQLDDMPDVAVTGVLHKLFVEEAQSHDSADQFQFFQSTDVEGPDVTEFDIVARAHEAQSKFGQSEDDLEYNDQADVSDLQTVDAGYNDFLG